jgi:hypothetical protein
LNRLLKIIDNKTSNLGCNELGLGFSRGDVGARRFAGFAAKGWAKLFLSLERDIDIYINARSLLIENTTGRCLDPENKSFKIFSAFAPVFRFHKNNNFSYIPRICQRCTFLIRDVLCDNLPSDV